MSKARAHERRVRAVAVAKDILTQIDAHRLEPSTKVYFKALESKYPFMDFVNNGNNDCIVCAIGACCLSRLKQYGDVGSLPDDYPSGGKPKITKMFPTFLDSEADQVRGFSGRSFHIALWSIFSLRQRRLIESAFQLEPFVTRKGHLIPAYKISAVLSADRQQELGNAIVFGQRYVHPRPRLRAIMENILHNDGLFVPPLPHSQGDTSNV